MGKYDSVGVIADHYGWPLQSMKCIEELAELSIAINRYDTRTWEHVDIEESCTRFENLVEEIADARIMIDQLVYLLDCQKEVIAMRKKKVARQIDRIQTEDE